MKNKDELRDELKGLSPFLAERQGKEEGFKVPRDYFKTLPDKVLEQLRPQPSSAPSKQSWLDNLAIFLHGLLQPRYAVAFASVVVLLTVAYFCFFNEKPQQASLPVAEVKLQDIPATAIRDYISNNIEDFDKDLILETRLANEKVQTLPNLAPKPGVEEMEQYLDDVIDEIELEDLEEML